MSFPESLSQSRFVVPLTSNNLLSSSLPAFLVLFKDEMMLREALLQQHLQERRIFVRVIPADGAYLVRAATEQIFGDLGDRHHLHFYNMACNWMLANKEALSPFVTEGNITFGKQVSRMQLPTKFSPNIDAVALSDVLCREIHVLTNRYFEPEPLIILHESVIHGRHVLSHSN